VKLENYIYYKCNNLTCEDSISKKKYLRFINLNIENCIECDKGSYIPITKKIIHYNPEILQSNYINIDHHKIFLNNTGNDDNNKIELLLFSLLNCLKINAFILLVDYFEGNLADYNLSALIKSLDRPSLGLYDQIISWFIKNPDYVESSELNNSLVVTYSKIKNKEWFQEICNNLNLELLNNFQNPISYCIQFRNNKAHSILTNDEIADFLIFGSIIITEYLIILNQCINESFDEFHNKINKKQPFFYLNENSVKEIYYYEKKVNKLNIIFQSNYIRTISNPFPIEETEKYLENKKVQFPKIESYEINYEIIIHRFNELIESKISIDKKIFKNQIFNEELFSELNLFYKSNFNIFMIPYIDFKKYNKNMNEVYRRTKKSNYLIFQFDINLSISEPLIQSALSAVNIQYDNISKNLFLNLLTEWKNKIILIINIHESQKTEDILILVDYIDKNIQNKVIFSFFTFQKNENIIEIDNPLLRRIYRDSIRSRYYFNLDEEDEFISIHDFIFSIENAGIRNKLKTLNNEDSFFIFIKNEYNHKLAANILKSIQFQDLKKSNFLELYFHNFFKKQNNQIEDIKSLISHFCILIIENKSSLINFSLIRQDITDLLYYLEDIGIFKRYLINSTLYFSFCSNEIELIFLFLEICNSLVLIEQLKLEIYPNLYSQFDLYIKIYKNYSKSINQRKTILSNMHYRLINELILKNLSEGRLEIENIFRNLNTEYSESHAKELIHNLFKNLTPKNLIIADICILSKIIRKFFPRVWSNEIISWFQYFIERLLEWQFSKIAKKLIVIGEKMDSQRKYISSHRWLSLKVKNISQEEIPIMKKAIISKIITRFISRKIYKEELLNFISLLADFLYFNSFRKESLKHYLFLIRFYVDSNRITSNFFYKIGTIYLGIKEYSLSRKYFEESLSVRINKFNEDHPYVSEIYFQLAIIEKEIGNLDKAINLSEKELLSTINYYGISHKNSAKSYVNLGIYHANNKNLDLAIEYFNKGLNIFDSIPFKDDPEYVKILIMLSNLSSLKKKYIDAINYLSIAFKKIKTKKNIIIISILNNFGIIHEQQNQFKKSEIYYKRALKCTIYFYKTENLEYAKILHNIAISMDNQNRYHEAIEFSQKSLDIKLKYLNLHDKQIIQHRIDILEFKKHADQEIYDIVDNISNSLLISGLQDSELSKRLNEIIN
jgi:hypothetical protein